MYLKGVRPFLKEQGFTVSSDGNFWRFEDQFINHIVIGFYNLYNSQVAGITVIPFLGQIVLRRREFPQSETLRNLRDTGKVTIIPVPYLGQGD